MEKSKEESKPKIHVLSSVSKAKQATDSLLLSHKILSACCKSGHNGMVAIVAMGTLEGDVYVFDVKKDRSVIFDGGVSRILQSLDVLKVMHGCSQAVSVLNNQHGIALRNVFDTQVAYSVMLQSEGLPERAVELAALCDKTAIPSFQLSKNFNKLLREDADVWMRRPITEEMQKALAAEVTPLLPHLYSRLLQAVRPEHQAWLARMTQEELRNGVRPGAVRAARIKRAHQEQRESAKQSPLLRLSSRQRLLLADTLPLCRLAYSRSGSSLVGQSATKSATKSEVWGSNPSPGQGRCRLPDDQQVRTHGHLATSNLQFYSLHLWAALSSQNHPTRLTAKGGLVVALRSVASHNRRWETGREGAVVIA
ncbi:exonuclease 3-5 domain-like-containing protein 1 protein [Plakobranchus ocellatus]|uniref:Exonuclease 3-5 domain-like-containing protein 1 protein n=1 Tax=Plakobranchus ocellatus TaxID=259542 RepID=A0AAV4CNC8_9GAST|nr:exonuclease 3-5 domain-like-containing protein 1 protein [Plakobranchus ocellatus]